MKNRPSWHLTALFVSLITATVGFTGGLAAAATAIQPKISAPIIALTETSTQPIVLAELSEESLPAKDLPPTPANASGGGAATAPSQSATPGTMEDWEQVPSDTGSAPVANSPDGGSPGNGAAVGIPQSLGPDASPVSGGEGGAGPSAGNPADAVTPSMGADDASVGPVSPPPALDATTINTGPAVSTTSLEPEIKHAANPALAASLRLTDEARKHLDHNDADAALRDLGRAVSIDGGNPFAYFFLGRAYMVKKNDEQALTFFKRAEIGFVARPEWLGETLSFEGACDEELGKTADAAAAYQKALAAAPNNLMARVGYGRLSPAIASPSELNAPPPAEDDASAPPAGTAMTSPPPEAPAPPASSAPGSSESPDE